VVAVRTSETAELDPPIDTGSKRFVARAAQREGAALADAVVVAADADAAAGAVVLDVVVSFDLQPIVVSSKVAVAKAVRAIDARDMFRLEGATTTLGMRDLDPSTK
jgi:hypothetical protein